MSVERDEWADALTRGNGGQQCSECWGWGESWEGDRCDVCGAACDYDVAPPVWRDERAEQRP